MSMRKIPVYGTKLSSFIKTFASQVVITNVAFSKCLMCMFWLLLMDTSMQVVYMSYYNMS